MNEIKYYIKDLKTGAILPTHRQNDVVILERANQNLEKEGKGHLISKRPATDEEVSDFLGVEVVDEKLEEAKAEYKKVFGKNPDKRIKDADKLNKIISEKQK
jgi:hypothetical protein